MHRFAVAIDEATEGADEVLLLPAADAQDWAAIIRYAAPLHLDAGQTLLRAGEAGRALYLLTDGTVELVGRATVVKTIEAPSVLGELAFLDGQPRSLTLRARTDCFVGCFDREALDELATEHPALALALALDLGRIAALRLRQAEARRAALEDA